MSDQLDTLESQVAELQAAVNGLTEELVETKDRVRELEEKQNASEEDAQPSASPRQQADFNFETDPERAAQTDQPTETDPTPVQKTTVDGTHARVVERREPDNSDGTVSGESESGTPTANEGEQPDEEHSSDEGTFDGNDIIVA